MKLTLLASALFSTIYAAGSWYEPNVPVEIQFDVEVEHIRTARMSKRIFRSEYTKSENYNREMTSVSVNLSGSASTPTGKEGSASIGVDYVNENESKNIDERKSVKEDEEHYQPGKNQIERIVTITTKINGQKMTNIQRRYVDIEGDGNRLDTNQMSIDYLNQKFVNPGNPPKTSRFATFYLQAMGCQSRREVLWRDRCYNEFGFAFRANGLSGYDGWFAPTPEPYLKIISNGQLYKSDASGRMESSNPKFWGNIASGSSLSTAVEVELWDHDTEGSHDLMCDAHVSTADLVDKLAKTGSYTKKLYCREGGNSEITFSIGN